MAASVAVPLVQAPAAHRATENIERPATRLVASWVESVPKRRDYALGNIVMLAEAGASVLQITGPFGADTEETRVDAGLLAMAGAGGAF